MSNILNELLLRQSGDDDEAHEGHDHDGPVVAKVVAMCILFLTSFILGCLPIKLSKMFKWDANPKGSKVVQLLLCFGGGVLLCTTFLHLLPEVNEHIEELQAEGHLPDVRMHFAEFLMCVGFFTMYLVEEIVHYYLHQRQKSHSLGTLNRSLSIRRGDYTVSTTELVHNMEEAKANPLNFPNTKIVQNGQIYPEHHHDHKHGDHDHVGHSHLIIEVEDSIVKSIRGLLVVLALSVHELFEGLAVGLETSATNVWYMFGAVSAHKLVIAFCIGVELVSTQTRNLLIIIYVFTFAVVSPMGIGIGIFVTDDTDVTTTITSVILQGLASGTLLYVVFFEILQKDHKGGLKQYLAILLGFLLMLAMTLIFILPVKELKVSKYTGS